MDKAARAVRRSSAKLLGGGFADLHLLLSEVKDMRNTAKSFMNAQNTVAQDLLKWAVHEENRALQDVANQLAELNLLWTEVQQEFGEHIKDYRHMFEMVLEGDKHVAQSKNNFAACEQRESKIRKELKKAFKKASGAEIQMLEGRLAQAERAKDLAQLEVTDRIRENEAVKLIRLKEGLMKLSQAYSDFGRKCVVVFDTQQDIVQQLPDVLDQDLEDIKYTGSGVTRFKVQQAKERVRNYRRASYPISTKFSEPPPPYSPQSYGDDEDSDDEGSSNYAHQSLSPRRRVSHTLDCSQQQPPPQQPPPQPTPPISPPATAAGMQMAARDPVTPSLHQVIPAIEPLSPSALPLSSSSPSKTILNPMCSPTQLAAAAAAAGSPPPPPPLPPSECAMTPKPPAASSSPYTGNSLYPPLPPPSLTGTPCSDIGLSPDLSHHHLSSDYPSSDHCKGEFDEQLFHKQHLGKSHHTPPLPVGTLNSSLQLVDGGFVQGGDSGLALEIVDFNPDWDNSYEEGLSQAMGGAKI